MSRDCLLLYPKGVNDSLKSEVAQAASRTGMNIVDWAVDHIGSGPQTNALLKKMASSTRVVLMLDGRDRSVNPNVLFEYGLALGLQHSSRSGLPLIVTAISRECLENREIPVPFSIRNDGHIIHERNGFPEAELKRLEKALGPSDEDKVRVRFSRIERELDRADLPPAVKDVVPRVLDRAKQRLKAEDAARLDRWMEFLVSLEDWIVVASDFRRDLDSGGLAPIRSGLRDEAETRLRSSIEGVARVLVGIQAGTIDPAEAARDVHANLTRTSGHHARLGSIALASSSWIWNGAICSFMGIAAIATWLSITSILAMIQVGSGSAADVLPSRYRVPAVFGVLLALVAVAFVSGISRSLSRLSGGLLTILGTVGISLILNRERFQMALDQARQSLPDATMSMWLDQDFLRSTGGLLCVAALILVVIRHPRSAYRLPLHTHVFGAVGSFLFLCILLACLQAWLPGTQGHEAHEAGFWTQVMSRAFLGWFICLFVRAGLKVPWLLPRLLAVPYAPRNR